MIDIWGTFGNGAADCEATVSVVVTAYNEGEAIVPCLDRILESVYLPCEVLVVYDSPDDTTAPWLEKYRKSDDRVIATLNTYGPGPGARDPLRLRPRHAPTSLW